MARNSGRKYVLFTYHALQRAAEYEVTTIDLIDAWHDAIEHQLSDNQRSYKFQKYGMLSLNDRYFWSDKYSLFFTVSVSKSGQWFIQTITNRKGNKNGKNK